MYEGEEGEILSVLCEGGLGGLGMGFLMRVDGG